MVLPDTSLADAGRLGENLSRVVEALNLPHNAPAAGTFVTVSVGGATTIPERDESFSSLVEAADKALYEAKRHPAASIVSPILSTELSERQNRTVRLSSSPARNTRAGRSTPTPAASLRLASA